MEHSGQKNLGPGLGSKYVRPGTSLMADIAKALGVTEPISRLVIELDARSIAKVYIVKPLMVNHAENLIGTLREARAGDMEIQAVEAVDVKPDATVEARPGKIISGRIYHGTVYGSEGTVNFTFRERVEESYPVNLHCLEGFSGPAMLPIRDIGREDLSGEIAGLPFKVRVLSSTQVKSNGPYTLPK